MSRASSPRIGASFPLIPQGNAPGQPGWRDAALCAQVDPELFFPAKGEGTGPAGRVCRACGVRPECLASALAAGEQYGMWGGLPERELRRERQRPVPRPVAEVIAEHDQRRAIGARRGTAARRRARGKAAALPDAA